MANRHFGNAGDVLKHLLLCELLNDVRAAWGAGRYVEAHAGDAHYPWGSLPARTHDAAAFAAGHALSFSRYGVALREFCARGRCPGSGALAMRELGATWRYDFFDLDAHSLNSLAGCAQELSLGAQTRCHQRDGLAGALTLPAERTFVFLDPFRITDRVGSGPDSLRTFQLLADAGVACALWYPLVNVGADQAEMAARLPAQAQSVELVLAPGHDAGLPGAGFATVNIDTFSHLADTAATLADAWQAQLTVRP